MGRVALAETRAGDGVGPTIVKQEAGGKHVELRADCRHGPRVRLLVGGRATQPLVGTHPFHTLDVPSAWYLVSDTFLNVWCWTHGPSQQQHDVHGHGDALRQKHHVKSCMYSVSPSTVTLPCHGVPQPQQHDRHFMKPSTGVITSFLPSKSENDIVERVCARGVENGVKMRCAPREWSVRRVWAGSRIGVQRAPRRKATLCNATL